MENERMTESNRKVELQDLMPETPTLVAWLVLLVAFFVVYAGSIGSLFKAWVTQEDYQHGFFVPIFAVFLLWLRREMIVPFSGRGSWWGLGFLAIWLVMRLVSVYFHYGSLPEMSIVPFLAGMVLFVGGWQGLRWAWPAIVFLVFMIPLPGAAQGLVAQKLQGIATQMSGFVIQTLGIPAMVVGHTIQIKGAAEPLDVAQACSGLRMMMLFFALSVGMAFIVKRPLWEKLLIVVSAAPIAVISNVARIVMTGVLGELARACFSKPETIETVCHHVHDWAGYLMMPLGLVLLWGELVLLSKLLISPLPERPLVVGGLLPEAGTQTGGERIVRIKRQR
jgi:exosortase